MASFPKDHAFPRARLDEHAIASLDEFPDKGAAPGRYLVGAPGRALRLLAGMHGDAPADDAKGHLRASTWLGRPTVPLVKSLIFLEDAIHLGQDCVVDAAGAEFPESTSHEGKPARGLALARRGEDLVAQTPIAVERVIEEPVLFLGNATGQFGHFLLDFMSKAWAVEWAKARGMKVAVYATKRQGFLDFQEQLLRAAGLSGEDFVFLDGPARMRRFHRPSPLYYLHRGAHPDLIPLCARLATNILHESFGPRGLKTGSGERVYLSRRLWGKRRILVNEAAVEGMLAGHGFAIVHPETLSLPEQIRVARHARHVAAPIGSQTYLSLFQARPASTTILAPSTFAFPDDAIISALRGVPTDFVLGPPLDPASAGPRDHDFQIDLAVLEGVMASRLDAAPAPA